MEKTVDAEAIRRAVREKYGRVSRSAAGMFKYPTGREGAEALGYDPDLLSAAPEDLLRSFCGVGNPFSLGAISEGEAVLDVGCGAGFDLFCAARKVGIGGRVVGLDLTPQMAEKARRNLAPFPQAEVRIGHAEAAPFGDGEFDVAISNGVFNLSPCKEKLFSEILRVLKPGGRLQFADIILTVELPKELVGSAEAWSQ